MDKRKLYAVTGLFDTPDLIIKAAKTLADKGYKNFDIHTPYPVHGMDRAMRLKPSKVGYAALALGLTGALSALLLMFWTTTVNYPQVIGGKPSFSAPAFVPIIFEVTVLLASVGTVLAMLFVLFKFPNNSHPLHDTNYMKKVSEDKYGAAIEAKDPLFNEDEARQLLIGLGAHSVETIYIEESELNYKPAVMAPRFIIFLIAAALLTSGATYFTLNKLMFLPPFSWMMEQSKIIPQDNDKFFADGFSVRKPVEGTVAKGYMPYQYAKQPETASALKNPLPPTEANLALGKKKYNTFCSPCHGDFAKGDPRLRGNFPNPPSLHSEKVRTWPDGRIYHVITEGQNIMPSYAQQITRDERWAIILYVRALQRALNAKEEDAQ
jgi:mono/diheme cytochrome c family protein